MNIENSKKRMVALVLSATVVSLGFVINSIEAKAVSRGGITTSSETEQMIEVEANVGESYVFTNKDTQNHYLDTNSLFSGRINVAQYRKNGTEYESTLLASTSSINVPAGGKAVITVESLEDDHNAVKFTGDASYFTYEKSSVPALTRVSMKKGENYVFTNSDVNDHYINTNSLFHGRISVAQYRKNGTEYGSELLDSTSLVKIPAGGKAIITAESINDDYETIEFGGYYSWIKVEKSSVPALTRVSMKKGENYVFTNSDVNDHYINTNSLFNGRISVAQYRKNGTEYGSELLASTSLVKIPAGGKAIITAESINDDYETIEFGGYYTWIKVEKSSVPALTRVSMKKGENYVFTNSDVNDHYINTNSLFNGRINVAQYRKNGTGYDYELLESTSLIKIPAGGKAVVTVESINNNYETIEFGGYYNWIKSEKSNTKALVRASLMQGQSYTFFNYDTNDHYIETNSLFNGKVDIFEYRKDGSKYDSVSMASTSLIKVLAGGKTVVKVRTVNDDYNTVEFGVYYNFFTKPVDTIAPTVKSIATVKSGNNRNIVITFTEGIQVSSKYNNVTLKDLKGKIVSVKLSISGNVLTIKPNSKLSNGKYTLFIPRSAVKDNSGNVLAKDYSVVYLVK